MSHLLRLTYCSLLCIFYDKLFRETGYTVGSETEREEEGVCDKRGLTKGKGKWRGGKREKLNMETLMTQLIVQYIKGWSERFT